MTDRRNSERRVDDYPHSLEDEKAVIGSLLIDNAGYERIASVLQPGMFYRAVHKKTYIACTRLLDAGKPLDLVSLIGELKRANELEDVGGAAYVSAMVDPGLRAVNIAHYAGVVREKAALRELMKIAKAMHSAAQLQEPSGDIIRETDLKLTVLNGGHGQTLGAVSLAEDAGALFKEIERRIERRGQLLGYSSGYGNIDLITHGFQRRKMVVIAGRTHMGKSVLALEWAKAIAQQGGRVVYYSLEMERQELQMRLLSALSGIPLELINWGNVRDFKPLADAWEILSTLPICINDRRNMRVADMRAECRRIKAEEGLAAVVVDHVQLVTGDGENRTQELSGISRDLFLMFGELDVTGFVVSQLNRGDKDLMREPMPYDLRESGALEQDADVIAMLHPYDPRAAATMPPPAVIPMKILFRKNRGGEMGVACLDLERERVRFIEAEPPKPIPKAEPASKPKGKAKSSPLTW